MCATLSGPAPHVPYTVSRPKISASFRKYADSKVNPISATNVGLSKTGLPKVTSNHKKKTSSASRENPHLDFGSDDENVYRAPVKAKSDVPAWRTITSANSGYGTTTSISAGSASSKSDGHSTSTSASSISTLSPNASTSFAVQKKVEIQPVSATRRGRAATTSSALRSISHVDEVPSSAIGASTSSNTTPPTRPTLRSTFNTSSTSVNLSTPPKAAANDGDREERLKSAADISIARQISVSRQQTQLLIPIKKANSTSPKPNSQTPIKQSVSVATTRSAQRSNSNPNMTSPMSMNLSRSPLQIVSDPESPVTGTPFVRPRMVTVKPSTPTLVVMGNDGEECAKLWGGQTASNSPAFLRKESGEIHIGLMAGSPVGVGGNRKSERVVLERVH